MHQLSFSFFWPLTEQIPLDLDYAGCERPKLTIPAQDGVTYSLGTWASSDVTITACTMNIEVDKTTITVRQEPPWYRKLLFNLLGINWEVK